MLGLVFQRVGGDRSPVRISVPMALGLEVGVPGLTGSRVKPSNYSYVFVDLRL